LHRATGDTWPTTWALDDNLYGSAGDNSNSKMNFWKIEGSPDMTSSYNVTLINNYPVDYNHLCSTQNAKPATVLSIGGVLYMSASCMNYGDNPAWNRQHNLNGFFVTSNDYGKTWNNNVTPPDFFKGRLAAPMMIQFGKDYSGAKDNFVYAYFPSAVDGQAYWCNNDYMLLGRVPKDQLLKRPSWEFFVGIKNGVPAWDTDDTKALPVFTFANMTGENQVQYNAGIKRYLVANYGFIDPDGHPRPFHQVPLLYKHRSQLTLFEAPEPWGPWSLFYRDDNWGDFGNYDGTFPTKWMSTDGKEMWMISAACCTDAPYYLVSTKVTLELMMEHQEQN